MRWSITAAPLPRARAAPSSSATSRLARASRPSTRRATACDWSRRGAWTRSKWRAGRACCRTCVASSTPASRSWGTLASHRSRTPRWAATACKGAPPTTPRRCSRRRGRCRRRAASQSCWRWCRRRSRRRSRAASTCPPLALARARPRRARCKSSTTSWDCTIRWRPSSPSGLAPSSGR